MSFAGNQYAQFASKVITTRGDIIRGDSSGDRSRYGIGASATVLTSDGTDPAWAAPAAGVTVTKVSGQMDATFSTASTSDVDVTDLTADLPTITDGKAIITAGAELRNSSADQLNYFNMEIDSTIVTSRVPYNFVEERVPTVCTYVNSTSGDTVQMSIHTQSGTVYVYDEGGNAQGGGGASVQILGVG